MVNSLLEVWDRSGASPSAVMAAGPPERVAAIKTRFEALAEPSRRLLRALVENSGSADVPSLAKAAGVARLAAQPRLKDLARKHGWVRLDGKTVHLTEPFLGAVLRPGSMSTAASDS